MEITKREIVVSVAIIALMLTFGIVISGRIKDQAENNNEVYNKAIQVNNNKELFEYGMRTNVGQAFVYGDLIALNPVTFSEIEGEYYEVRKVKEVYTMHTRTVYTTDTNGNQKTETEIYWTWDYMGETRKKTEHVEFCGVQFSSDKIQEPKLHHIEMQTFGGTRYKYSGSKVATKGTIFTNLANKTISDKSKYYEEYSIEKALERSISEGRVLIISFWGLWITVTSLLVYGFYYLDNRWLNK